MSTFSAIAMSWRKSNFFIKMMMSVLY